jgi:hypothetical protein
MESRSNSAPKALHGVRCRARTSGPSPECPASRRVPARPSGSSASASTKVRTTTGPLSRCPPDRDRVDGRCEVPADVTACARSCRLHYVGDRPVLFPRLAKADRTAHRATITAPNVMPRSARTGPGCSWGTAGQAYVPGDFRGRPPASGRCPFPHFWTSRRSQIGPEARRTKGAGK